MPWYLKIELKIEHIATHVNIIFEPCHCNSPAINILTADPLKTKLARATFISYTDCSRLK